MLAIAWGLIYFFTIYLFETQYGSGGSDLGLSVLYSVAVFFGVPFFLNYFEAKKNVGGPLFSVEKVLFSFTILAFGTKGGIFSSSALSPIILGFIYVFVFFFFHEKLHLSYRRIGIYPKEYYERVMGEFPLQNAKLISQFRTLIYSLPIMFVISSMFWDRI